MTIDYMGHKKYNYLLLISDCHSAPEVCILQTNLLLLKKKFAVAFIFKIIIIYIINNLKIII